MKDATAADNRLPAYPEWINRLPEVDTAFPGAHGRLLAGPHGQLVMWTFENGGCVPPHKHGPQIGVVIRGSVKLSRQNTDVEYLAGDSFTIEDDEIHGAEILPGTLVMEVFAEHDRHRKRAR